jgi:hypothetical protein
VQANSGEQIAGFAKMEIYVIKSHYLKQTQEGTQILEEVESEFGYTPAGLSAKMTLNDERNYFDLENWLDETNSLAQFYGCPTLPEVLSGTGNLVAIPGISKEEQEWAMIQLYHDLIARLGVEDDRMLDELEVNLFLRGAIRTESVDRYTRQLIKQYALEADRSKLPYTNPPRPEDTVGPSLALETPTGDPLAIGEALEMTISDGDFLQSQTDTSSISFSVDGLDVTQLCTVRPEVELSQVLEQGSLFEEIHILYFVESRLTDGSHHAILSANDHAGNSNSLEFDFTVSRTPEEPVSLASSRDSILSLRSQHQNDGANPLLTLEEIQGKATRSAVAFNLAEVNLNGLSRATLVLTVDPNEHVDGWGNGRSITAKAVSVPWIEGNGKSFGLKKKDQVSGNGSGVTWFSPVDEDISNDSSNSAVNWNGAAVSAFPPTAPAAVISNGLSGEVEFDVTADVLNGAENGWLILKDQENVGSKISFYSREGAAAAGDSELAPRLILEYGDPVASTVPPSNTLLSRIGFGTTLRTSTGGSELRSVKEVLQETPVAAFAVEQILMEATRSNPVLSMTSRVVYHSWLAEEIQIAAAPIWSV